MSITNLHDKEKTKERLCELVAARYTLDIPLSFPLLLKFLMLVRMLSSHVSARYKTLSCYSPCQKVVGHLRKRVKF